MKELTKRTEIFRYFNPADKHAEIELGTCIIRCLRDLQAESATPIILCIGTDRATGDCLGPLVGDQLLGYCRHAKHDDLPKVIGCLSAPVHALNIREVLQEIRTAYDRPFVIAVDASLGASSHVGLVTVSEGPLLPGKGVQKKIAGNRRYLHYRHCKRIRQSSGSAAIHPSVHGHAACKLYRRRSYIFHSENLQLSG